MWQVAKHALTAQITVDVWTLQLEAGRIYETVYFARINPLAVRRRTITIPSVQLAKWLTVDGKLALECAITAPSVHTQTL